MKVSDREQTELRRTYTREVKALKLKVRFMNDPTRMKEGKKAVKRLRTIAKAMVNDIARKISDIQLSCYREDIELYLRVIKQERSDKDKVYSLHEPEVECISKGKEHEKYEFGNKSAIAKTGSGLIVSALVFLLVYGVDGCCTILHRIMLHENLGEAHRKHAYQLMANELRMSHVVVSLLYFGMQLVINLVMIYLIPNTVLAHWIYLVVVALVLIAAYVLFMKKYYHLHEEYLASLKK